MIQEVLDDEYIRQAEDAGLGDFLVGDEPKNTEINEDISEISEDFTDESDFYDWIFSEKPKEIKKLSNSDLDELSDLSPSDGQFAKNYKQGEDTLIHFYGTHQQGAEGWRQIMSGRVSPTVARNMRNNMLNKGRNISDEDLIPAYLHETSYRLGKVKPNFDENTTKQISKAAQESGINPEVMLKIAAFESSGKANAVSPSGKHLGYFQVNKSYVSNPAYLTDPYTSTKIAIRHNKNQFVNGKLDYQLGGTGIRSVGNSSFGYTPINGIPYSSSNSAFPSLNYPSSLPTSGSGKNNLLSSVTSLDPTGTGQIISAVDKIGAGVFSGVNDAINFTKEYKDIIGKSTDDAISIMSSIIGERKSNENFYKELEKLSNNEVYNNTVDYQKKPKTAWI